jgi:hypothetical protein
MKPDATNAPIEDFETEFETLRALDAAWREHFSNKSALFDVKKLEPPGLTSPKGMEPRFRKET